MKCRICNKSFDNFESEIHIAIHVADLRKNDKVSERPHDLLEVARSLEVPLKGILHAPSKQLVTNDQILV